MKRKKLFIIVIILGLFLITGCNFGKDDRFIENTDSSKKYKGIIYLDPTDLNKKCEEKDVSSKPLTTKGCMKWYVYSKEKNVYKMILDHNISGNGYYSSETNSASGDELEKELKKQTKDWQVDPRIMTMDELTEITGKKYEKTNTFSYELNKLDANVEYGWLTDNMKMCKNFGKCYNEVEDQFDCYSGCSKAWSTGWYTSTTFKSYYETRVFTVQSSGVVNDNPVHRTTAGIRPVIWINRK